MVDTQAKKIVPWAATGPRVDPESARAAIVRAAGWPIQFAVEGGPGVERLLANQIMREITGMCTEMLEGGSIPVWDDRVNYTHVAFVMHDGTLYVSTQSSGPDSGGSSEPGTTTDVAWKEY